MTRRLILAALLGLVGALAAQEQVFRVDVKLVRVLATVKDTAGQMVGDLNKQDFQVFDNGVPQQLAVFEHHTEQALSIALMIDTSASTGIDLRYEVDSVRRFLHALFEEGNPDDAVSLYTFNWETVQRTGYTHRVEEVVRELKGFTSGGGTSLYDAIYFAAQGLEERDGRHVMVLVTDGGNTTSVKTFNQAIEAAQRADAVIYPVLVMPITNDAGRNIGGENALTTMSQRTGGKVFLPTLGEALDAAFSDILRDLRTQYLLGFYPRNVPPTDEPFHRLEVKLRRPDLRVSARSGYYGETEQAKGWRPVR